jgi:ligand-binding sensor domain-containing protein
MFLYISNIATGQKLLFQHLGTEHGLIQSNVTHLTQDKKGNIWIGTSAGLSVFDGKKFTNYDDLHKLSSLRINNIVCDHKGVVWIATDNGMIKFDKKFTVVFKSDTVPFRKIFQLTVDNENNKYFIYSRQIYQITDTGTVPVKWNLNIPSRSPITVISVDSSNSFWVATADAEAFKITQGKATRLKVPVYDTPFFGSSPLSFLSIIHHANGFTSFESTKGIHIVENDSLVHVQEKYRQLPEKSRTISSLKSSQSSWWLGSDSGVFKILPDGTLKQFAKANGFTNTSVTCILEDAERNLWFGTNGNGLYQLSTEAISLYDQVDEIDLSNIESTAKTDDGSLILGSFNHGIIKMKGKNFIKNPFSTRTAVFRYVTGLAAKNRYTFITTFGDGVYEYDNKTSALKPARLNVREPFVNAILPYNRGFLIYAGGRYLYSFDNNYKLLARKDMPLLSSLFSISDSTFLFIQNNQIDIYDANINLTRKNVFTEIHSRVSCLEFYGKYILAGTIGEGLFLYDNDFKFIKKLPSRSNIIYALKFSGNHLFIGSNTGLSKLLIAGFPEVQNTEEKIVFNGECKEEGILTLNNDTILVTSSKGLFVINTREDDFNYVKPMLTVEKLEFKNNTSQLTTDFTDSLNYTTRNIFLNIPFNKNELIISLKGISQSSPGNLRYQFILQNYEEKWNITDNGELIRYTNLKPGNYVFKARLSAKGISSPHIEIPFTIDQPLQARWWFQILIFGAFIIFAIILLKVFNMLNQRYIQTKWINRSKNELQAKKTLIGLLVKSTKNDLQSFKDYFIQQKTNNYKNAEDPDRFLDFYFKTTINRLDIIWEKDYMNLEQINETLRNFCESSFDREVEISHTASSDNIEVPSEKAEKIIRLFSLFIFYSVQANGARQFALTSKVRLGNQLFLKIYSTETQTGSSKNSIHHHLHNNIRELNSKDFVIEFIESQNLGYMIILRLNLEPTHVVENDFH